MVSSLDWLSEDGGSKRLVASGTNMPVIVLKLEPYETNGLKTYKIEQDKELTGKIADTSTVLAYRKNQDASILVTED